MTRDDGTAIHPLRHLRQAARHDVAAAVSGSQRATIHVREEDDRSRTHHDIAGGVAYLHMHATPSERWALQSTSDNGDGKQKSTPDPDLERGHWERESPLFRNRPQRYGLAEVPQQHCAVLRAGYQSPVLV